MKTTLFLSVSIDGFIANKEGIPLFPKGAWEDWCSFVNKADNVIVGRSSYESLKDDDMASALHPKHPIVLSTQNIHLSDSTWQLAKSPSEALAVLKSTGIDEAIIGGGRAVAYSFIQERLVNDIVIDLQPIAFGKGIPMFGDILDLSKLKLLDSHPLNENALRLRYQILRDRI